MRRKRGLVFSKILVRRSEAFNMLKCWYFLNFFCVEMKSWYSQSFSALKLRAGILKTFTVLISSAGILKTFTAPKSFYTASKRCAGILKTFTAPNMKADILKTFLLWSFYTASKRYAGILPNWIAIFWRKSGSHNFWQSILGKLGYKRLPIGRLAKTPQSFWPKISCLVANLWDSIASPKLWNLPNMFSYHNKENIVSRPSIVTKYSPKCLKVKARYSF